MEIKHKLNIRLLKYAVLYKKSVIIKYLVDKGAKLHFTDSPSNCSMSLIKNKKLKENYV